MDFDWSPEEIAFRDEVREFIASELTDEVKGSIFIDTPARIEFVTKMAKLGWLGMGFPEEYGGSPNPFPLAQFILNAELDRSGAPIIGKNVGTIASTIFHVASEEMKKDFLPKIFRNEGQWA
ncbi:MAG: alkylation response protein AidB-like acyl-CoA dehydrogenase, partial [Halioglobus sp.]